MVETRRTVKIHPRLSELLIETFLHGRCIHMPVRYLQNFVEDVQSKYLNLKIQNSKKNFFILNRMHYFVVTIGQLLIFLYNFAIAYYTTNMNIYSHISKRLLKKNNAKWPLF